MNRSSLLCMSALAAAFCLPLAAYAGDDPAKPDVGKTEAPKPEAKQADQDRDKGDTKDGFFKPEEKTSDGSVTVGGKRIDYQAVAGTLVVHPQRAGTTCRRRRTPRTTTTTTRTPKPRCSTWPISPRARPSEGRPVTFLFNGGPGSSSVWLHMGAFGPRRVVTLDDSPHAGSAIPVRQQRREPARCERSGLRRCAGHRIFSRIAGKDKEKAFYGIDADGHAFGEFISVLPVEIRSLEFAEIPVRRELRHDALGGAVQPASERSTHIDLNGVILLSQILSFDTSVDGPETNPGIDIAYELVALPTYAATAWYHHKLPRRARRSSPSLVAEVEHFAMTDYALALGAGAALDPRQA